MVIYISENSVGGRGVQGGLFPPPFQRPQDVNQKAT